MGTMAMFWDRSPLEGGRALGWFAMDGHPDTLSTLAEADSRKSFLLRLRALGRRKDRHWFDPVPGRWMCWPSDGLFVMDFGYWWDDAKGCVMFVHRRSAAIPLTPEVARDSELWPEWNERHPAHVGVLLPELHASADPRCGEPMHRWATFREWDGEQEAARVLESRGEMEIVRRGKTRGTWAPDDWDGHFEVRDSSGKLYAADRKLAKACGWAGKCMRHALGPVNGDFDTCYRLYSVEAFMMEAMSGDAAIRHDGKVYQVVIDHPIVGHVEASSDLLAEALLTVRRNLHAHPGFRLENAPGCRRE